eukprot:TRINITY_DN6828_c0_g1_i1.p1 TRINITY_DN6828_c0_g1~~TRINITY_DN6828_c0_g1_i1.p1  ORF type:complete len:780 (+),score=183.52 TRINITY_DN6828_c0_g1_i1:167-2506(+)
MGDRPEQQSLVLKVNVPNVGTKTLRFEPYTSVKDALVQISRKSNLSIEPDDHVNYCIKFPGGNKAINDDLWLDNQTMYLQAYGLRNNDVVVFCRQPKELTIETSSGNKEKIFVDFDETVRDLISRLVSKLDLDAELGPYELHLVGRPQDDTLDLAKTLSSQHVLPNSKVLIRKRRKKKGLTKGFRSSVLIKAKKKKSGPITAQSFPGVRAHVAAKSLHEAGIVTENKETKTFGATLTEALYFQDEIYPVPYVVHRCIEYLEKDDRLKQEGIFRQSGQKTVLDRFKIAFDQGKDIDLETCDDPNCIAGLLKLFFRELSEPLLTTPLYRQFIDLGEDAPQEDELVQGLRSLVRQLPATNYATTHTLFTFLTKVADLCEENKMTAENLATVFGPNLLRTPDEDLHMGIQHQPHIHLVVTIMIRRATDVFSSEGFAFNVNDEDDSASDYDELEIIDPFIAVDEYVRAKYTYEKQATLELSFEAGDLIKVLEKDPSGTGWWKGDLNGQKGMLPSNFCVLLTNDEVQEHLRSLEPEPAPAPIPTPARPIAPSRSLPSRPPRPSRSLSTSPMPNHRLSALGSSASRLALSESAERSRSQTGPPPNNFEPLKTSGERQFPKSSPPVLPPDNALPRQIATRSQRTAPGMSAPTLVVSSEAVGDGEIHEVFEAADTGDSSLYEEEDTGAAVDSRTASNDGQVPDFAEGNVAIAVQWLVDQLKEERTARQSLEGVVSSLEGDVSKLKDQLIREKTARISFQQALAEEVKYLQVAKKGGSGGGAVPSPRGK